MISVVDLSTGKVGPAIPIKVEKGWTVEELKQYIGEVRGRIHCHFVFINHLLFTLNSYLISIHHV